MARDWHRRGPGHLQAVTASTCRACCVTPCVTATGGPRQHQPGALHEAARSRPGVPCTWRSACEGHRGGRSAGGVPCSTGVRCGHSSAQHSLAAAHTALRRNVCGSRHELRPLLKLHSHPLLALYGRGGLPRVCKAHGAEYASRRPGRCYSATWRLPREAWACRDAGSNLCAQRQNMGPLQGAWPSSVQMNIASGMIFGI